MSIDLISRKCPNCSANLELTPGSENGRCEYCGSSFIVTQPGADTGMNAASGWKMKKFSSDWAQRIADLTVMRFQEDHKIDLSEDPDAMKRIAEASRKVVVELQEEDETTMNIPFIVIVMDTSHPLHICEKYTRSDMAETD
ncbi:MAG: Hsp70 family protein [Candidatus Sabulitectum sp.]|nr:Hsp70 family protein [Candidatus Sabulitectum sp.]